jgi:hypothetical protein
MSCRPKESTVRNLTVLDVVFCLVPISLFVSIMTFI